jgi:hypothetical protein
LEAFFKGRESKARIFDADLGEKSKREKEKEESRVGVNTKKSFSIFLLKHIYIHIQISPLFFVQMMIYTEDDFFLLLFFGI